MDTINQSKLIHAKACASAAPYISDSEEVGNHRCDLWNFHGLVASMYWRTWRCVGSFTCLSASSCQCGMGDRCAMKFGPRIGKLCDCGRGANCNSYLLKCIWSTEIWFSLSVTQHHVSMTTLCSLSGLSFRKLPQTSTRRLLHHHLYPLCIVVVLAVAWGWAWTLYCWRPWCSPVACKCFMFNKHIY